MVLNGYVDESGDEIVFVMAGFVAPAEEWAKFSKTWASALSESPAVRLLKTKDAMQTPPQGSFFGLTSEQRNQKLSRLYSVVDDHVSYSVYAIVHMEPLRRLAAAYGFPKQAANPYYHAINTIISGVAKIQIQQGITGENVDWIFDERLTEQGKFLSVWEAVVHDIPGEVRAMIGATPVFRKDHEEMPLQAADLETWWMRRKELERMKGLPRLEYPWLPSNMPVAGATLGEAELTAVFAEMNKIRERLAVGSGK